MIIIIIKLYESQLLILCHDARRLAQSTPGDLYSRVATVSPCASILVASLLAPTATGAGLRILSEDAPHQVFRQGLGLRRQNAPGRPEFVRLRQPASAM